MKKLNELTQPEKYRLLSNLKISLIQYVSSIDNTALTYAEIKNLLDIGLTSPQKKSLYEQSALIGFAEAYDYVIKEAHNQKSALSPLLIMDIHSILFAKSLEVAPDKIKGPVGKFSLSERHLKGIDITLLARTNIHGDLSLNDIARFHIIFNEISPFADGNEEVGILIMIYQTIKNNYIPPSILNEDRLEYLNSFKDVRKMERFLERSINETYHLIGVEQSKYQGLWV